MQAPKGACFARYIDIMKIYQNLLKRLSALKGAKKNGNLHNSSLVPSKIRKLNSVVLTFQDASPYMCPVSSCSCRIHIESRLS